MFTVERDAEDDQAPSYIYPLKILSFIKFDQDGGSLRSAYLETFSRWILEWAGGPFFFW